MQLLLIRHCEASGQQPEAPLSEDGATQAERLSQALVSFDIDAVYTSPFARAIASAAPLSRRLGLPTITDDRLRERLLAPNAIDDWLDRLRRSFDDPGYRVEGGESQFEAQTRGLAAIADIAAQNHNLPVVVSHGNLIAAILATADKRFGFEQWRAMTNPDCFRLTLEGGAPGAFERLNLPT